MNEHSLALEWKRLGRLATAVALMTSPILFVLLSTTLGWAWYWCVLAALDAVVVFRGELDVPLEATVPRQPPLPEQIDLETPEAKRLDALTLANQFTANFRQSQDASLFLVLER